MNEQNIQEDQHESRAAQLMDLLQETSGKVDHGQFIYQGVDLGPIQYYLSQDAFEEPRTA